MITQREQGLHVDVFGALKLFLRQASSLQDGLKYFQSLGIDSKSI